MNQGRPKEDFLLVDVCQEGVDDDALVVDEVQQDTDVRLLKEFSLQGLFAIHGT